MKSRSPCGTRNRREHHCFQRTLRKMKSTKKPNRLCRATTVPILQPCHSNLVCKTETIVFVLKSVGTLKATLVFFSFAFATLDSWLWLARFFHNIKKILHSDVNKICQSKISPTYCAPVKYVRVGNFVWHQSLVLCVNVNMCEKNMLYLCRFIACKRHISYQIFV